MYNLTRESEDKPNRTIKFKFMIIDDLYFYY